MRTFVAIAFALALTSVYATFTPTGYVKAPIQVIPDSETNFTNITGIPPYLGSITFGNVYLIGQNVTVNTNNMSANSWTIWAKQLNMKDLSVSANTTYSVTHPLLVALYNNYAISMLVENDTTGNNIPQLRVYQTPLTTGGAQLPRLVLSTNNNQSWNPSMVGTAMVGKTVYVFYTPVEGKINCTSFVVGGVQGTNEFTVTSAYTKGFNAVWGESLSSSQVFAMWIETDTLKDAVIDVSKGSLTAQAITGYNSNLTCRAYATDKKWYGEFCTSMEIVNSTSIITYWIRTNTTAITKVMSGNTTSNTPGGVWAYGPYLAVGFSDSTISTTMSTYLYEIWNLDTMINFKNRTQYLQIDGNSTFSNFRVPQGGLYTLFYNNRQQLNQTLTTVSVGLLLGSSYLASVIGFLMTIIAGLFLF